MCTFLMGQHKADLSSEIPQGHQSPRGQAASVNCSRAAVKQVPASLCGQGGRVEALAAATSSPEPLAFSMEAQLYRDLRGIGRGGNGWSNHWAWLDAEDCYLLAI